MLRCPRPHCGGSLALERGLEAGSDAYVCLLCGRTFYGKEGDMPRGVPASRERQLEARPPGLASQNGALRAFVAADAYANLLRLHQETVGHLRQVAQDLEAARAAYVQARAELDRALPAGEAPAGARRGKGSRKRAPAEPLAERAPEPGEGDGVGGS